MESPTGRGIRVDEKGDGHYGAPRGDHRHHGIDFLCDEFAPVGMPIDKGRWVRNVQAYSSTAKYKGVVIEGFHDGDRVYVKLLYMEPKMLAGVWYRRGDVIGEAQDISKKMGGGKAHVHMEVYKRYDFQTDMNMDGLDE